MKSRVCAAVSVVALAGALGMTDASAQSAPKPAATAQAEPGTGPVREKIAYEVTFNGRSHKVTVAPA